MSQWDIDKVDEWVDEVAVAPVRKFYPSIVAKDTGLTLNEVFSRLLKLVEEDKLNLQWEVRCPTCYIILGAVSNPESIGSFNCYQCGEDVDATPDIIFPVFLVNPRYKDYLKGKKKQPAKSAPGIKLLGAYAKAMCRSH